MRMSRQEFEGTVLRVLGEISHKLARIQTQYEEIKQVMATGAQALTDLTNAVAANTTVTTSVETLITNLAAQVAAANSISPAAVEALVAQLQANTTGLASAVTANTPAAPASATPPATSSAS